MQRHLILIPNHTNSFQQSGTHAASKTELQNMKSYFHILSSPVWFHFMWSLVSLLFRGAAFEQRSYSYFCKFTLLVRQS